MYLALSLLSSDDALGQSWQDHMTHEMGSSVKTGDPVAD